MENYRQVLSILNINICIRLAWRFFRHSLKSKISCTNNYRPIYGHSKFGHHHDHLCCIFYESFKFHAYRTDRVAVEWLLLNGVLDDSIPFVARSYDFKVKCLIAIPFDKCEENTFTRVGKRVRSSNFIGPVSVADCGLQALRFTLFSEETRAKQMHV